MRDNRFFEHILEQEDARFFESFRVRILQLQVGLIFLKYKYTNEAETAAQVHMHQVQE